jgi:hypothetical protein
LRICEANLHHQSRRAQRCDGERREVGIWIENWVHRNDRYVERHEVKFWVWQLRILAIAKSLLYIVGERPALAPRMEIDKCCRSGRCRTALASNVVKQLYTRLATGNERVKDCGAKTERTLDVMEMETIELPRKAIVVPFWVLLLT